MPQNNIQIVYRNNIFILRCSSELSGIHTPTFFKKNVDKLIDMSNWLSVCMVTGQIVSQHSTVCIYIAIIINRRWSGHLFSSPFILSRREYYKQSRGNDCHPFYCIINGGTFITNYRGCIESVRSGNLWAQSIRCFDFVSLQILKDDSGMESFCSSRSSAIDED